jgi:hypothetical protein
MNIVTNVSSLVLYIFVLPLFRSYCFFQLIFIVTIFFAVVTLDFGFVYPSSISPSIIMRVFRLI